MNRRGQARLQAAQELILLQRIEADQDDDAVAEQDRHTIFIDAERQRRRGQHVAALEAGRVDAVRDEEGAGGGPGPPSGELGAWVMKFRTTRT